MAHSTAASSEDLFKVLGVGRNVTETDVREVSMLAVVVSTRPWTAKGRTGA